MCGLAGYVGYEADTSQILVQALESLAYRGYDSAGIGIIENNSLTVYKTLGHPRHLTPLIPTQISGSRMGVAHTRWATHGEVNLVNAHPQATENLAVVHNGIITNFKDLKQHLEHIGYHFISDTDTEVITHLMEHHLKQHQGDPSGAFQSTLTLLEGSFSVCLILKNYPETLWGAAQGTSPLVVAQRSNEGMMISDIAGLPLRPTPWQGLALEEKSYAILTPQKLVIRRFSGEIQNFQTSSLVALNAESDATTSYPHHTYGEMMQQPNLLRKIVQARPEHVSLFQSGATPFHPLHLTFIGCGSSYYAAATGAYAFEYLSKIPTSVRYASEALATLTASTPGTYFVLLSQSGETADVISIAKNLIALGYGDKLIGLTNRSSSTLHRNLTRCLVLPTGVERGVAATKSFSGQLLTLLLMAQQWSSCQELRAPALHQGIDSMEKVLKQTDDELFPWLKNLYAYNNLLLLGRYNLFPIACEGALKLKELAYIHAEALPAGEMKHGPLALIDETCPVIVLAPYHIDDFHKIESNIREIVARHGKVFLLTDTHGAAVFKDIPLAGLTLLPATHLLMTPFTYGASLQRLAYALARHRGCSIDYPRNLAKSVSVD